MRAIVFDRTLKFISDYPVPRLKKGEALVRVTKAGICNTDLEITKGYMEFQGVLGHEFVGVVEKSEERELIGKRVTGEINLNCGSCSFCKNHLGNHCPKRSVLGILKKDGAFADYITLPVRNLHRIPDSISDDEAVFVEPVAAAFEILDQVKITSRHKVAVLGDGKLGLLVSQVIASTGCDMTAVGKHPEKLAILDEMGIKTELKSKFRDSGFDVVIDCTGSGTGIDTALEIVKPRGNVIMKTTVARRGAVDLNRVVVNEIIITGSRCGPFKPAINAIRSGDVNINPLISSRFSMEEWEKAFQAARKKGSLKVIIEVS